MKPKLLMVRLPNMFRQCNFFCPYCTADIGADDVRYKWPYRENHRKIIENLVNSGYSLNLRLGPAGEFFLSKHLIEDARWLTHQQCVEGINLITNGGFSIAQYQRFFADFKLSKVALTISYHHTDVDDFEKWKQTVSYLASKMPVSIVLVAYPPLIYLIPEIYKSLEGLNLPISINGFIGTFRGKEYPENYTDIQNKMLKEFSLSRHEYEFWINGVKPGLCYAGSKSIYVNIENGKVYSCGYPKRYELGEVLNGVNFSLLEEPKPCMNKKCMCDSENYNPVVFDNYYKKTGISLRQYEYKFQEEAKTNPLLDEWRVQYW